MLSYLQTPTAMKLKFIFLLSIGVLLGCKDKAVNEPPKHTEPATVYYFIRHAEKDRSDPNNENPFLTPQGHSRAIKWQHYFNSINLDAVYTTDYARTYQTATPIARRKNVTIQTYDPNDLYNEAFKKATLHKKVLVVGHSNTTPAFANAVLGEEKYPPMDDSDNASLYIVTVRGDKVTSEKTKVTMDM